jgi:MraZ protein
LLRGNYPATVDQKGRLKIPAAFLAELREMGEEFYVTSENGDRAVVYPMKEWSRIEERLAQVPSHNEAKRKFLTRTNYYGQVVTLDKQGRLLIPPVLRESAQMQGEVDVLGYQKHLEVWNHARFTDHLNASQITAEDAKALDDLGI